MANPIHNAAFDIITWGDMSFAGAQARDNYITVSTLSDKVEDDVDASGGVPSYAMLNDRRADVTISIPIQSPLNAALSDIVAKQRATGDLVIQNISFAQSSTNHIYDLQDCVIKKLPDESKSNTIEGQNYEWMFRCSRAETRIVDDFTFSVEVTSKLEGLVDAMTVNVAQF